MEEVYKQTQETMDEIKETVKEKEQKSQKFLLYIIGFIILIIAAFLITQNISKESEFVTKDEMFNRVIKGDVDEANGYMYNGYAFVFDDILKSWFTRIQIDDELIEISLHFGPRDLENVTIYGSLDERFNQKTIYLTFDPNSTQMSYIAVSAAELSLNLAKGLNAIPVAACTSNESACIDRPILTCDNTDKPVIYIKKDNRTAVMLDGNCVTLKGNEWGITKAVDKFLLNWYRIMD